MSDEQPLSKILGPEKALIFRIIHRDNLAWVLKNGLHCASSEVRDPGFVTVGNQSIIERREAMSVPIVPGGSLSDYVPFYFTPKSPMMFNIHTGNRVQQRKPAEIVIFVSSLPLLAAQGVPFVFTDRHAVTNPLFSSDLADLGRLPWSDLQNADFRRDPENPGKFECYQAEALVHRHLPVEALQGVACYNDDVREAVQNTIVQAGASVKAVTRRGWYF